MHQGLDYLPQTGDPSGGIVLITGVPGIGKTQLARRFTEDARGRHKGVVSCAVETSVLESPVSLLMDMAKRVDSVKIARKAADMDSRHTGGAVDVARLFSRSRTKEHVRHTPSFGTLLRESADAGMWKSCSAMVLVIDELQTVTPEGMKTLRVLHEGNLVKLMRDRNVASLTHEEATQAVCDGGREDGAAVVWKAIEHGVLKLGGGEVSFGIPAFHAYMRQSLSRAEARAQQAQGNGVGR